MTKFQTRLPWGIVGVCANGRCEGMVKRLIQDRSNRCSIRLPGMVCRVGESALEQFRGVSAELEDD